ncbi:FAD-dependent oxidoreductase [Aspergillus neoniger CBS 115656]|uniref:Monooxygenase n=1 Tax=Aspergillus neoniger (strain CBS 115656) TaxID=1448310 RepID=A0A318YKL9_ASPNB|nr:monooxygenase [Aspergillus neoniger CBS 115656]PYH34786.1 monooxygenase [Aspergillus neoniger CBS 115656]
MSKPNSQRPFHVIIVGASIAGLTLAHCLSNTGIELTILEARSDTYPDGAGLAILPNGARILDQLGLYQDVLDQGQRMVSHSTWLETGHILRRVDAGRSRSFGRINYPVLVITRRALLGILYTRLRSSRLFFNRRVVRIVSSPENVTVHSADGMSVSGDLVVGADGVHSIVREQMWHHIRDTNGAVASSRWFSEVPLTDSFAGVFGIAQSIPRLKKGDVHRTYGHGWLTVIMVGADSRVCWFMSIARTMMPVLIPRHTSDRAYVSRIVEPFLKKHVTSDVTFGEVFNRSESSVVASLEEGFQNRWSWGRFVGIGDAMAPNIAEGANCAIESAASLANHLVFFARGSTPLYTEDRLTPMLKAWEDSRKRRTRGLFFISQCAVRIEAATSCVLKLNQVFISHFHGTGIGLLTSITSRTARVDYLPLPLPQQSSTQQVLEKRELESGWSWRMIILPLATATSLMFYVLHALVL